MKPSRVRALAGLVTLVLLAGSTTACESSSKRKKRAKADRDDDRRTVQSDSRPSARPSPSRSSGSPLRWAGKGGRHTVELGVGDTLYDGLAVVQNVSATPLTLVSVTTAGRSPAVQVQTAGVVTLSDRTDESLGVVRAMPAGMKLSPLTRAEILPRQSSRTRYAIVFTVRGAQPGRWQAPAVQITYRAGSQTHRFELGYALTVCVAPGKTTAC